MKYSREIELVRGIQTNINNGEFVLVLRTDGRIVAMSDEVEHHLGKTMVKNLRIDKKSNLLLLILAFALYSMCKHFRMS